MLVTRRRTLLAALTTAVALAIPGSATAATTTSVVGATVGSEVSLAVGLPAAMVLTHSAPGTTNTAVVVTSTAPSWTLSIADNNTGAGAGHLLKAIALTPLQSALQWSPDGTTFQDLSGTPATVGTGSLVQTKNVYFRQALGATEAAAVGDSYSLTVAYTVA
jgi:hypothetical protein